MAQPSRSPIIIEIALKLFYSQDARSHYGERWDLDAFKDARRWLVENGLANGERNDIALTSKGRAWVHLICETPLPTIQWVIKERVQSVSDDEIF